ncbi:MAG: DUF1080 domain-containing protein [Bryobacteraceae bacterium]|nr:DUF1080 domain-containing protein [Bryobacteraceae bacterium]
MLRRGFLLALPAPWLARAAQNGFEDLFDGRTLRGWTIREGPSTAFYVDDGAIVVHRGSNYPAWLSADRAFENFDFRCEFFLKGWSDSGIYLHAAEHGPPSATGMKLNIFHQRDEKPKPESMGAIFPLVAPKLVNVREGEWNPMRILMDWPQLRVWVNDEPIHDLDVESVPELRYRLRSGFIGLESLSYPVRFRNLRIRELPPKEKWEILYEKPEDFDNWFVSEGSPGFEPVNEVIYGDGIGHIASKRQYRDFELHMYIRADRHHNGGVLFRTSGKGLKSERHYEIQLHNVPEAHYPTGSLYYFKRARYPRIEDYKWYLMQLRVEGPRCLVRINGETVLEYDELTNLETGHIELQAHQQGKWTEFKKIRIKRL